MSKVLLFCFQIFFLLVSHTMLAQSHQPDTSFVKHAVGNAVESYRDAVALQAAVYSGAEYYTVAKPYLEGHQFFEEKTVAKGAVLYNGAWFYELPLLYEVVQDELVTYHLESSFYYKLVKQKIDKFILRGHTFVRLDLDSAAGSPVRAGFYDMLYDGNVKVLARREKDIQERVSKEGKEGNYNVIDKFYLQKNGAYYQVGSKGSVLKVLGDRKKELKEFCRANKLKFRKQRESAILELAQHYDTLTL